jgi:hypothetical protein
MILSLNSRRKLLLPRVDMFPPSFFTLSKSSQTRQAWTEPTFQIVPQRPISRPGCPLASLRIGEAKSRKIRSGVDMFPPSFFTFSKSSQTRQAWTKLTFQIVPRRPISIALPSKKPLKRLYLQAFLEISSISPSAFLTSLKSSQGRWIQHETMFSNRPTKANFHASASKKPAQHACIYRLFLKFHPFFAAHF